MTGDLLLVAAGREPDTEHLDLDRAGVRRREDGRIEVDEYGRTTAEGIWSLGDASSPYQLKHVANAEARTLAHNLAFPGDLRRYPHDWVPGGGVHRAADRHGRCPPPGPGPPGRT